MAAQKIEDKQWVQLRRRAELLVKQPTKGIDDGQKDDVNRLIHEIQVKQAELEMQNDELAKSRDATEAVSRKYEQLYRNYAGLFNFAPTNFLVIGRDGVIHEINLGASILLDAPRSKLSGRCITDFIHRDDQDCFYYQKLNCQKSQEAFIFELKMKRVDGAFFDAQLKMQSLNKEYGNDPQYIVAVTDISERVQQFSSFALQQNCLELACRNITMKALLEGYVQLVKSYLQCDAVGIRIHDPAGKIPYHASDGFSQAFYESDCPLSLDTNQGMCTLVIKGTTDPNMPFFTEKGSFYINGTGRFLATMPPEYLNTTQNVCHAHGYESVALIPINIDNTIRGLIHTADRRENNFSLRVVETLEYVGSWLGLAIQRLRIQENLRESLDALNDLSSHLLTIQEDEQRRIALELHDGCGQDLNVMKLHLASLKNQLPADATGCIETCDDLLTYFDQVIDDIRNIAHGLKPTALDALGLTAAARQMLQEYATAANLKIEMEIESLDQVKDSKVQICLFRIFQEALTNIHKHAQASWVLMAAGREGNTIRIRIEDNGIGFDAQKQFYRANGQMGMGLSALQLRCRMIGADLSIDSEEGKGTRLAIRVPCPNPKGRPMKDYRIILADDHVMMRQGIKNMIDAVPGLAVTGEAGDGLKLLKLLKKKGPDMVILDISMPGLRGIEAAHEINALYPDVHVLMLSMHKSEDFLSMALEAGARGYLLKEDSGDELIQAIAQIRRGGTYLSKKLVSAFPSAILSICQGKHKAAPDPLTPRERQVLQMIAEGNTDPQISDQLCISVRTVHRHHAHIRSKLNLKRTADLVKYAIAQGYTSSQLYK